MLRRFLTLTTAGAVIGVSLLAGPASGQSQPDPGKGKVEVSSATHHDVSKPLRQLARLGAASPSATPGSPKVVTSNRPMPDDRLAAILATNPGPPVIPGPTGPGDVDMPSSTSFEGVSNVNGVYPPDTDGDVGPNHYVEMVNLSLQIFNKQGVSLLGPVNNNTLWAGFGGDCETTNDGDPITQYDQFADRWMMSQFSVSGSGFHECVAVSTTPDPTGSWYRYSFDYSDFADYPKFGVWPDGYYVTYNMFNDLGEFIGAQTCALDRSAMLTGAPASQQCFTKATEWSLLPSDADGPTPPPAGSPNYILGEHWSDQDKLTMYKFHVDWDTPANSTFTGPINLSVNPFTWACVNVTRGRCVPQKDTSVRLDSLGGRTMYRLAYRNFGDHESLVTNHTVAMDGNLELTTQTGIGWYELRDLGNPTPTVHQEGTSADPNGTTFRWMGSIAQDKRGNMALGYSTSSSTTFPGIRYNGRLADDPLNTLPQAESSIIEGTGAQTGVAARWGDYSAMHVDPVDDCTFWYVNEYVQTTGNAPWRTRIANFRYPGCAVPDAPTEVSGVPDDGKVSLSWTAPASDGGYAITGYTATASPGGATCTTNGTGCDVTGLTNGQAYTFTVTATNSEGTGPASDPSSAITPRTVPGAPTAVSGSPGDGKVSLDWTAPGSDGGAAIAGYTATASPGGATCTTAGTDCDITGLANGKAYTFTVTATNAAGDGPASPPFGPITPRTVPGAPGAVSGTPSAPGSATVSWQPPTDNGGSAITSYTATAAPGAATCSTGGTSCVISGLNPGGTYTFTVVATNVAGDGPPSAASAPVDLAKLAQTAKVKVPTKIKPKGKTVLLKKAVKTNAGINAEAKVRVKPKGKKYAKVKITKKGKVTIKTSGKKKLKVTLTLTAPATAQYNAYSYTKKWKVKRRRS